MYRLSIPEFLSWMQVSGRVLFPAAAMFEAARAAGAFMLDGVQSPSVGPALIHATIPAAFELPAGFQQQAQAPPLSAQVTQIVSGSNAGSVSLHSMGSAGSAITHLRASMAHCQPASSTLAKTANLQQSSSHNTQRPLAGEADSRDQHAARAASLVNMLCQASAASAAAAPGDARSHAASGLLGGTGQAACPIAKASSPLQAEDGFCIHPAAADSCMHVGALCGTPDGRIRVPGALGAFLAGPLGRQAQPASTANSARPAGSNGLCSQERWAVGVGEPELADGTRRLSYSHSGHMGCSSAVVAGLEAKVLRPSATGMCSLQTSQGPICLSWYISCWSKWAILHLHG